MHLVAELRVNVIALFLVICPLMSASGHPVVSRLPFRFLLITYIGCVSSLRLHLRVQKYFL